MRISKASLNIEDPALLARILLLGTAFVVTYYCFSLKTPPHCWERVNHLSVFGFLPESVLGSAALFSIARVLCIASLGLWLLHRFIPWSPIVATLSFTALVAQHVEMSFYTSHTFHFATNVLIVLCAWYCFDRSRMSAIRPGPGYFKGTAPRWVFITILSYIAISYTHRLNCSPVAVFGLTGVCSSFGS